MMVLGILVGAAAFVLLLPTLSDLVSLARIVSSRQRGDRSRELPRLLFLVPAHNEELLIQSCLASVAQLDYPRDRFDILVVADNCTDRTVEIVRRAGVRCLERTDTRHRGKPHALAWAVAQLRLSEFDGVVIVDGDTVLRADFARAVSQLSPLRDKAVQPFNDVANPEDNALTRMAAVLSTANHRFAYGLRNRVGLNVPLSAGMCVGTNLLEEHGWPVFSIGEDWELYAFLTERGTRIEAATRARIFAQEAHSLRQSASQRKRWMGGKLTVLARYGHRLLKSRRIGAAQKLDALAELSSVGPAVHLGIVLVAVAVILLTWPPGAIWIMLGAAGSLVRPAVYAALAIGADPQPLRTLCAFGYLPFYTVWRLGTAAAALGMVGNRPWVQTRRHAPESDRAGQRRVKN
jgi:cellulose synthase/poly-beta-1,6-N-acetylglucosamine synthase-like glycosyltransferase